MVTGVRRSGWSLDSPKWGSVELGSGCSVRMSRGLGVSEARRWHGWAVGTLVDTS